MYQNKLDKISKKNIDNCLPSSYYWYLTKAGLFLAAKHIKVQSSKFNVVVVIV
jgi:hypothetical protein